MAFQRESLIKFAQPYRRIWQGFGRHGVRTAVSTDARVKDVSVTDEFITFHLADGRVISVPLAWSWRLSDAAPAEHASRRSGAPPEKVVCPQMANNLRATAG